MWRKAPSEIVIHRYSLYWPSGRRAVRNSYSLFYCHQRVFVKQGIILQDYLKIMWNDEPFRRKDKSAECNNMTFS
jgi:hypothetical protein